MPRMITTGSRKIICGACSTAPKTGRVDLERGWRHQSDALIRSLLPVSISAAYRSVAGRHKNSKDNLSPAKAGLFIWAMVSGVQTNGRGRPSLHGLYPQRTDPDPKRALPRREGPERKANRYARILRRTNPPIPINPLANMVSVAGSGTAPVLFPTINASELGVMYLILPSTTSIA